MRLNESAAILSSKCSLVPYCAHHVRLYHQWMQDPELQAATASEPLDIEQEYAMQRSWRQDHDKLTFIICMPVPDSATVASVSAYHIDAEARMIGDINLFVVEEDLEDGVQTVGQPSSFCLVGEVELMVAPKDCRRRGYGKAALLAFFQYLSKHLASIMAEYSAGRPASAVKELAYLRVKINEQNHASLALFESIGFAKVTEHANFFGEMELRFSLSDGWSQRIPLAETVREVLYAHGVE